MKKIIFILIIISVLLISCSALAYESAYNVVHVFNQKNYTSKTSNGYNLTVYLDGKATTLQKIGCNLFTYAHAIQWLEHRNYSTKDEYLGLLSRLVKVCNTPSATRNGYVSYMTNTLGYTKTSITKTEAWLKSLFDQGGCARVHIWWRAYGDDKKGGGHYFLAIGYTERNGEFLIQMLDSNPWSTVNRIECRDYSTFKVTKDSSTGKNQYWIPLSRFTGTSEKVYNNRKAGIEFLEGYYPGTGAIVPQAEIAFNNIKYPSTYKINSGGFSWGSDGGTITAPAGLASVEVDLYNTNGTKVHDTVVAYPNSTVFKMQSISPNIKISKLTSVGTACLEIRATDNIGNQLSAAVYILVKDSSTVTSYLNRTYTNNPELQCTSNLNDTIYELYKAYFTWEEARDYADALGGYLACVNSYEENQCIFDMIKTKKANRAWLGGYRSGSDYQWINGESFNYTNWVSGEPDRTSNFEKYIGMNDSGTWYDVHGKKSNYNYFVVEYPPVKTFDSGDCGENVTWVYQSGVLSITGTGPMYDYEMWETPWEKYTDQITTIEIGQGITTIGDNAFCGCEMMDVIIPDSVTSIGINSFYSCSQLQTIKLPNRAIAIGEYAFDFCVKLRNIEILGCVSDIGGYAFSNCESLKSIEFPEGLTSIGDFAFMNCTGLERITIPESVTSIGFDVFCDCTNIQILCYDLSTAYYYAINSEIPYQLLSISTTDISLNKVSLSLFVGESEMLIATVMPSTATNKSLTWNSSNTSVANVDNSGAVMANAPGTATITVRTVDSGVEATCVVTVKAASGECGDNLTWSFDNGVLRISGTGTMLNFENRYSTPWFPLSATVDIISIGNEVSSIGDYAFSSFNNVTSIAIPSSITSIGIYAFGGCANLTSVGFVEGSKLRTIGEGAFMNCGIEEMVIPSQVSLIGKWAFYNCSNMSVLSIPGVASTGEAAFANCSSLTSVWIEEGTTEIGNNSFRNCSNLTYFYMPGTLTRIGDYAFDGCGNLTTLYVEGRSVSIGTSAIPQNANLTLHGFIGSTIQSYATANEISFQPLMNNPDFVLPPRLNTIEEEAFSGINASMIYIPDGATSIGEKAFRNCINLQEIRIPESVQSIADNAFEGCRNDLYIYSTEGSSAYNHVIRNGHIFVEEQYAIPRNGIVLNSN